MKKKTNLLAVLMVITAVLVALAGAYMKYVPLAKLGLFQQESVFAVPFLLLSDKGAQYALQLEREELAEPTATEPPVTQPEEPVPETTVAPEETEVPTEPPETEAPTQPPTEPPVVQLDESWFDDALFIGDSRMVGLQAYAPLGEAHYFCRVSMGVFTALDWYCQDPHYGSANLEKLLTNYTYGKIILGLGTNETGYEQDWVIKKYREIADLVVEKQPDAHVIVQLIMNVSKDKAASSASFTPERMADANRRLREMAEEYGFYVIDPDEWSTDEEGFLRADLTGDGVHPTYEGYLQWSQWILDVAGTLGIPPEKAEK